MSKAAPHATFNGGVIMSCWIEIKSCSHCGNFIEHSNECPMGKGRRFFGPDPLCPLCNGSGIDIAKQCGCHVSPGPDDDVPPGWVHCGSGLWEYEGPGAGGFDIVEVSV